MEPISEALQLLKRQAEIQQGLRRSSDNPMLAERELYLIRNKLAQFPDAVQGDGQTLWPADLMSGGTARTLAHGRAGRSLAKQGELRAANAKAWMTRPVHERSRNAEPRGVA